VWPYLLNVVTKPVLGDDLLEELRVEVPACHCYAWRMRLQCTIVTTMPNSSAFTCTSLCSLTTMACCAAGKRRPVCLSAGHELQLLAAKEG
jgi:hypothetical protein